MNEKNFTKSAIASKEMKFPLAMISTLVITLINFTKAELMFDT